MQYLGAVSNMMEWSLFVSKAEPFNITGIQVYAPTNNAEEAEAEWFALETNRDHSVIFEIAPKNCISDSFVDYEGYSICSKRFLPTIVDLMVIWIEFTHSSPL